MFDRGTPNPPKTQIHELTRFFNLLPGEPQPGRGARQQLCGSGKIWHRKQNGQILEMPKFQRSSETIVTLLAIYFFHQQ